MMGNDWVLVPREPTEAMMKEGARVLKAGVGWSGASQGVARDVYQAMCRARDAAARDAAPIAGEREAFEAQMRVQIGPHVTLVRVTDESRHAGEIVGDYAVSEIQSCWLSWSARAALPSGGGAREAALALFKNAWIMPGYEQDEGFISAVAAIITRHIPSAPTGLTEEERSEVAWTEKFCAEAFHGAVGIPTVSKLLAIIKRLKS